MAYGKITTKIDPKMHEQAKLEALKRGTTLRELIEEGLRHVLETPQMKVKANRPVDRLKAEVAEKVLNATLHGTPKDDTAEYGQKLDEFNPQPKKGKKK